MNDSLFGCLPVRSRALAVLLLSLVYPVMKPAMAAEELSLVLETVIFAKNLEYPELSDANGRTFMGDIFSPYIRHRLDDRVRIELGATLSIPFGSSDSVDEVAPLIRLDYEFLPDARLIMGTLYRDHNMLDILFDDDLAFLRPVEQGAQILIEWPHWHQDVWINWQMREDDFGFEKFDVGWAAELRVGGFRFDLQMHWIHFGGERFPPDNEKNNPAFAVGLGYHLDLQDASEVWRLLRAVDLRVYGFYAEDNDTDSSVPDRNGEGVEMRLELWPFDVHLFYTEWFGDNFIAGDGDPLFTFDRVTQVGADYTVTIYHNFHLSFGGTIHVVDDHLVHTLFLLAHWQLDYRLSPLLRWIRPTRDAALTES